MANETKHRPGPWRLVKDKKFPRLAKIIDADGDEIEETVAALSDAREMATCRLIASAPELLEMLQMCERVFAKEAAHGPSALISLEEFKRIRAAIAKASAIPDYDPTPWCSGCEAMRQAQCACGPIAEND